MITGPNFRKYDQLARGIGSKEYQIQRACCTKTFLIVLFMIILMSTYWAMFCDACQTGVGYVLMKVEEDSWFFIPCGLTTLSETQKKYTYYDKKLVAIAFSCIDLHKFMSSRLPFEMHLIAAHCMGQNRQISKPSLQTAHYAVSQEFSVTTSLLVTQAVAGYLSRTATNEPLFPDHIKFLPPFHTQNLLI